MSEKKFSDVTVILAYYNTATKVAASLTGQVFGPATLHCMPRKFTEFPGHQKSEIFDATPPNPKMARPIIFLRHLFSSRLE
jgi:hypothetical protein